jgi:hypothetical protein
MLVKGRSIKYPQSPFIKNVLNTWTGRWLDGGQTQGRLKNRKLLKYGLRLYSDVISVYRWSIAIAKGIMKIKILMET